MDERDFDEMGTDDLLSVLRESLDELPRDSTFRQAWECLDTILTNGGPECLPAPWE